MKKRERLYQLARKPHSLTAFLRDVKANKLERTLASEFLKLVASQASNASRSLNDRHPEQRASPYRSERLPSPDGPQTNGASQAAAARQMNPARPQGPSEGMKAGARLVALKIADSFMITERQGSRTAIGDIPVGSYSRLIRNLGKRTWVSSREYNTICILKGRADRQASIPTGAKTRDVFSDAELKDAITLAQSLATPQIEKNPEIINA